jgi:hypothetical protein
VDEGLGGSSRSDEYQKKTSDRDEDSESMIEAQTRRTFFPRRRCWSSDRGQCPGRNIDEAQFGDLDHNKDP